MKYIKDNPILNYDSIKPYIKTDGDNEFIVRSNKIYPHTTAGKAYEIIKVLDNVDYQLYESHYMDEHEWIFNGHYSKGDNTN